MIYTLRNNNDALIRALKLGTRIDFRDAIDILLHRNYPVSRIIAALRANYRTWDVSQSMLYHAERDSVFGHALRRQWTTFSKQLRGDMARRFSYLKTGDAHRSRNYLAMEPQRSLEDELNLHTVENLAGFQLYEPVRYEELPLLRFHPLVDESCVRTRSGEPLRAQIEQLLPADRNLEELLSIEQQFDRIRDEIASQGSFTLFSEVSRFRTELPLRDVELLLMNDSGRPLGRIGETELGALLREESQLLQNLRSASEQLFEPLKQIGVKFINTDYEGMLGEYNLPNRCVTVYPLMIELTASSLTEDINFPERDCFDALYALTEIHETAHAVVFSGRNLLGRVWSNASNASRAFHETLAQYYTWKLIQLLSDSPLLRLFEIVNEKQSVIYQLWRHLEKCSEEQFRSWLLSKRQGDAQNDLLSFLSQMTQVLANNLEWVQNDVLSRDREFADKMQRCVHKIGEAQNLVDLNQAIEQLMETLRSVPRLKGLLMAFLPDGLPEDTGLVFLLLNELCAGEGIGAETTLRFTRDAVNSSIKISLTAGQNDMKNQSIRELSLLFEMYQTPGLDEETEQKRAMQNIPSPPEEGRR